jgi:hypothetical protein
MTDLSNEKQGCLATLLRFFGITPRKAQPVSLPYRVRDDFLSPAEMSFYHVLSTAVGPATVICPKVRLADLSYLNRITPRHVDFLLCRPGTMKPVLGIELDDTSHSRPTRRQQDEFVDRVFESAGLPLLRIPVQRGYDTRDLAARVAPYLGMAGEPPSRPAIDADSSGKSGPAGSVAPATPLCPKCGVPMVLRTAGRGKHQGEQFYGCPNYPQCREMLPVGRESAA